MTFIDNDKNEFAMPNWCQTNYVIEGDTTEIKELKDILDRLEADASHDPAKPFQFGRNWLGYLVEALGGNSKDIYCRGTWENARIDPENGHLTIDTMTAWNKCTGVEDLLKNAFPSLEFTYFTMDEFMNFVITNDREMRFFPERVLVAGSDETGDTIFRWFSSNAEAYGFISQIAGQAVSNETDMEEAERHIREKNEDAWLQIIRTEIVEN